MSVLFGIVDADFLEYDARLDVSLRGNCLDEFQCRVLQFVVLLELLNVLIEDTLVVKVAILFDFLLDGEEFLLFRRDLSHKLLSRGHFKGIATCFYEFIERKEVQLNYKTLDISQQNQYKSTHPTGILIRQYSIARTNLRIFSVFGEVDSIMVKKR